MEGFAQDPAYNDIDKQLLNKTGISPIDDPRGFPALNENTLVYYMVPSVPVTEIDTDIQWPAGMLWNFVGVDRAKHKLANLCRLGKDL